MFVSSSVKITFPSIHQSNNHVGESAIIIQIEFIVSSQSISHMKEFGDTQRKPAVATKF